MSKSGIIGNFEKLCYFFVMESGRYRRQRTVIRKNEKKEQKEQQEEQEEE